LEWTLTNYFLLSPPFLLPKCLLEVSKSFGRIQSHYFVVFPNMHELAYRFFSHIKATWRYRWFAVVVAWILALAGWTVVYRMPDRYEATARVWLNTQSVMKPLLAGLTAQPNVEQMVGMLSRTLISRPNLEKVIQMAGLESGMDNLKDREHLTTRLMRQVTLVSAGADNLFTISYTDKDPQKAKLVVQSLLTIFVESSLGEQRRNSEVAQRFIDEELRAYQEKLDAAENAVVKFKQRQTGLMAGRGEYSVQLVTAEAALNEAMMELKIAEINRDAIKKNVPDETEVPSLLGDKGTDIGVHPEFDARISALEQKLDVLRLTYTENHPDIVAVLRTIAALKEQTKVDAKQRKLPPAAVAQAMETGYRPLTLALAAAEANVASVKARVDEYAKRYKELRAAAVAAPEIDADYAELARNYEVAKSNYGALLTRREQARISAKMEATTSASDFRVVDPPQVPSMPKTPSHLLLNSVVLAMALVGGIGFAFLLSQIRPTFNDERMLREYSGVQVLGTVNIAWTDAQRARRARGLLGFMLSLAALLSAYAAINITLLLIAART
jgi:polysaccharide chain length determinant protein (PEP-CTERM system associated)